jgi:ribosomal protein S18 acetylase RimI-like enzyme
MNVLIRTISGEEWRLWRSLRLRAVEESPDSFRSTLIQESAEADEWWRDLIGKTAEHPHGLLLVAEADGDPVGMLFGRIDEPGELLDVGAMWVDPDLRRRGIGRGLIDAAVDWARASGVSSAELWVTSSNVAAVRLYEQAGFTSANETEPLRDGAELVVVKMAADLSEA